MSNKKNVSNKKKASTSAQKKNSKKTERATNKPATAIPSRHIPRYPLWYWPVLLVLLVGIAYLLYAYGRDFYSKWQYSQQLTRAEELGRR